MESSNADLNFSRSSSLSSFLEAAEQFDLPAAAAHLIDRVKPVGQRRTELVQALAREGAPRELQHHLGRERIRSSRSTRRSHPHRDVGHEARVVVSDIEIHERKRLLDLIHDQAEQARSLEQLGQQPLAIDRARRENSGARCQPHTNS